MKNFVKSVDMNVINVKKMHVFYISNFVHVEMEYVINVNVIIIQILLHTNYEILLEKEKCLKSLEQISNMFFSSGVM